MENACLYQLGYGCVSLIIPFHQPKVKSKPLELDDSGYLDGTGSYAYPVLGEKGASTSILGAHTGGLGLPACFLSDSDSI